jgi:hypothetical protein
MQRCLFWLSLISILPSAITAEAGEPPKIDRSIVKEPAYESKPVYFLLIFGAEGKTRVWCVRDGDVLYADKNGNGDLTEPEEKISIRPTGIDWGDGSAFSYPPAFLIGDVTEADGKIKHSRVWLGVYKTGYSVNVMVKGKYRMYSSLDFDEKCAKPATAPFRHVNGPLRMYLLSKELVRKDDGSVEIAAAVATDYASGEWAFVDNESGVPRDKHPLAEVAFPGKTPDARPVTVRIPLTQRC